MSEARNHEPIMPIPIHQHCSALYSTGTGSFNDEREGTICRDKSNRVDEHHDRNGNQVELARPHQRDVNGQTRTQQDANNTASMLERGGSEALAEIREVMVLHNLAKLVPCGVLDEFVTAGVSISDEIESLSSRRRSSVKSSFASLLPTLRSRRPLYISTGAHTSNKKCGNCHVMMGAHEGVSCMEDAQVNEGLTTFMLSNGQIPNDDDALAWLEHQQSTFAADSFLYLGELSSLSDEEDQEDDNSHRAEKQDSNGSRRDELQKKESNHDLHLLDHCCHKSLIGSEIVASAATMNIEEEDSIGRHSPQTGESADDCCNATQNQSKFLHESSLLLGNHDDITRKARDPGALAGAQFSPTTFTSSTTSFFGSLAPAPNKAFRMTVAQPRSTTTHLQQQNKQDAGHSKKEVERGWNKDISFDLQSKEKGRRHGNFPKSSLLLESVGGSSQQLIVGSTKTKLNKASKDHDMDSGAGRKDVKAMEGKGGGGEVRRLCLPPATTTYGDTMSRHKNADMKATNKKDVQEVDPWYTHFQELVEYKTSHGHCNVPFRYENDNPFLAAWVKRQRYQYKCKIRGKHSHLTDEREKLLEELGFVWDTHVAAWDENFAIMAEFYKQHGHCCVPVKQRELNDWAKRQRRLYKQEQRQRNASSTTTTTSGTRISDDRIRRLNEIQFQWATTIQCAKEEVSNNKKRRSNSSGNTASPLTKKLKKAALKPPSNSTCSPVRAKSRKASSIQVNRMNGQSSFSSKRGMMGDYDGASSTTRGMVTTRAAARARGPVR